MEQRTSESGPEPAESSETPPASPDNSPSESIEEILKRLKAAGWQINPGGFSAILPGVHREKPKPDEKPD